MKSLHFSFVLHNCVLVFYHIFEDGIIFMDIYENLEKAYRETNCG